MLGAPNDDQGNLGPISRGRADRLVELSQQLDGKIEVFVTGGFGDHFNRSPEPHYIHVKRYLTKRGMSSTYWRMGLDTGNTVGDFWEIRNHLVSRQHGKNFIITSEYHIARAKYVASCLLGGEEHIVDFVASGTQVCTAEMDELIRHEVVALAHLNQQGGVYWQGLLYQPKECGER